VVFFFFSPIYTIRGSVVVLLVGVRAPLTISSTSTALPTLSPRWAVGHFTTPHNRSSPSSFPSSSSSFCKQQQQQYHHSLFD
jgi:hypothetical protein